MRSVCVVSVQIPQGLMHMSSARPTDAELRAWVQTMQMSWMGSSRCPESQTATTSTQLCYARQHGIAHLQTLFHPKDRLPAHLVPPNRPTQVQAVLLMDAQIPCTCRPVSDVHSKDTPTSQRQEQ